MSSTARNLARLATTAVLPLLLSACPGGSGSDGNPDPAAPSVTISANPTNISAGGTSTISWNVTDATSCTATGAWSGSRATSGDEVVGPLNANAQFTLQCTGPGGNASGSATVMVSGGSPAPTLNLSADAAVVTSGSSTTLRWNTSNVDTCQASGDWSGSRAASGSESTGNLTANASYTLNCSGPGGNISDTVTVTVSGGGGAGIVGSVDSSYIDRLGVNRVYVYSGTVMPDDYDGDAGDPMMSGVVVQDPGACTFRYDLGSLAAGDYTLAFTSEAGNDNPSSNETIAFDGVQNVTVGASTEVADFDAASIIRVGPGRTYQTVAAAANAAQDGDVIEIDAGEYAGDVASWYQDNLTIRGVGGGRAHMRAAGANAQGKGIWVFGGSNTTVENIEFSEITVPDQNGVGIRAEGRDLVVCNGYFHDSDEGILGGYGDVLVEYSEFDNNGYGDGQSHNMYILEADRFVLQYSYSHHARIGHNVKSRAAENYILYNRIMDEQTGTSSYAVDLPNGGLSFLIGNLLQQGPNTDNSSIVSYGTEGLLGGRTHNLYVVNNTFVDDRGGTFLQVAGGTSVIRVINNLFVGSGNIGVGNSNRTSNLQTTAPGLVDIDNYDYRLTATSPARDQGTAPGSGNGVDLTPVWQYVHPRQREARPTDGTIDIGAYEYSP